MQRVLVVEDDPIIRNLIVEILVCEGYESMEAGDGRTGVELARSQKPDVVLMDLNLPVLDGVSAIKKLKRDDDTRTIKTIAMSAGTNLRVHAEDLPADGVLVKPFDLDTLLAVVLLQSHESSTT